MKAKTRDDFLMSPTVDYCFKELLEIRLHGSISENLSLSSCLREPK